MTRKMGGPSGLPFLLCDGRLGFGRVEGIGCGVRDARGSADVLGIAASSGSGATVGVGATDEFNLCQDAGAIIAGGLEEKPGNCGGLRRRALADDVAFDGTAIEISPTWTGTMHSNLRSGCVIEGSIRGLKDPLRGVRNQLAFIDLNAFAGDRKDGVLAWRRVRGGWNLGDGGDRQAGCEE